MTRRSLFQTIAGAMAGSLLVRLPFVGPLVEPAVEAVGPGGSLTSTQMARMKLMMQMENAFWVQPRESSSEPPYGIPYWLNDWRILPGIL